MTKRSLIIFSILLAVLLTFSGCGGGNSILGGSISFINDSNPFVGTWVTNTTSDTDNQIYRYDQFVFTAERFTKSFVDHPNWGSNPSTSYTYEIAADGTWYFLNDGNHIYIKYTSHKPLYVNDPYDNCTDSDRQAYEADRNSRFPLNTEIHYTYSMNDAKTQFTITNVANPSDSSTWTRR